MIRRGFFFDLIKASQNDLKKMVEQGLIVSCSSVTCLRTLDLLKEIGVEIVGGDSWGEGRRKSLKTAMKKNFDFLISSDFDKVLHWLKVEKQEFFTYLFSPEKADLIIAGRSNSAWKTYPKSWRETEMPLNSKLSRIIGQEVDILVTQLKMRKKVAELISQNAVESSWPSGAEWPLIAWKNNFKIEARFFEGLSWEDPDRLSLSKKEIEKKHDSPKEWEKRFKNAKEIDQFISRF